MLPEEEPIVPALWDWGKIKWWKGGGRAGSKVGKDVPNPRHRKRGKSETGANRERGFSPGRGGKEKAKKNNLNKGDVRRTRARGASLGGRQRASFHTWAEKVLRVWKARGKRGAPGKGSKGNRDQRAALDGPRTSKQKLRGGAQLGERRGGGKKPVHLRQKKKSAVTQTSWKPC